MNGALARDGQLANKTCLITITEARTNNINPNKPQGPRNGAKCSRLESLLVVDSGDHQARDSYMSVALIDFDLVVLPTTYN